MGMTHPAIVDDDSSGGTGTVWNNAWESSHDTAIDAAIAAAAAAPDPGVCEGRLTLTTGLPVTTADVTGATTVYFTPNKGSKVALYSGSVWALFTLTERSLALGTLVNAQAYDVFLYNNAGTLTLEFAEWANATVTMTIAAPGVVTWTAHGMATGNSITFTTSGALPTGVTANTQYWITVVDANTFKLSTSLANVGAATFITTTGSQSGTHTGHQPQARATALVAQDGVLSKTGALTRRYLGSFLTTATTTTEDSYTKRFLSNYYNRVRRGLKAFDTTNSWTYTTAAWRQANANAANQVGAFIGVADVELEVSVMAAFSHSVGSVGAAAAIKEDAVTGAISITDSQFTEAFTSGVNLIGITQGRFRKYPTVGYHIYAWLEYSTASGTTTWYGDNGGADKGPNTGIMGTIEG